jgi:RNA polymerase sigma factor (sigma-70 family)
MSPTFDIQGEPCLGHLFGEHRELVVELASRYATPGIDPSELVRAGVEGLVDAATRFDESCGRFSDFAAWWVRRRIVRRVACP